MGCEEIINLIREENALDAKKALEISLYERAAYALRDIAPDSSRRSFRDQNACPDHIILGEAEKSPEQKAFQALFDKILKKHGVDSPNELEDSKKDDFFNEVEREWKKDPANKPEKNESTINESNGSWNPFDFQRRQDEYFYRKFWEFMKPFLNPTNPNIPDGTPEPAPGPGEQHHGPAVDPSRSPYQNTPMGPKH